MGLISDILKDIPLSANLQEKLRTLEAKFAALETENAILKDDLRKAQAENQRLKAEIDRATPKSNLDETTRRILTVLAQQSEAIDTDTLTHTLQLHPTKLEYYLHKLEEDEYVYGVHYYTGYPSEYGLSQKGREFVIENNLL